MSREKYLFEQAETADGQKLRELIQSAYEQVSACLLPHPGDIIKYDGFDITKMHPDFRKVVVNFTTKLFDPDNIVPKRLADNLLTGTELFIEAQKWHDSFNEDESFVGISYLNANETEFQMAYNTALDYYDNQMSKKIKSAHSEQEMKDLINEMWYFFNSSLQLVIEKI